MSKPSWPSPVSQAGGAPICTTPPHPRNANSSQHLEIIPSAIFAIMGFLLHTMTGNIFKAKDVLDHPQKALELLKEGTDKVIVRAAMYYYGQMTTPSCDQPGAVILADNTHVVPH